MGKINGIRSKGREGAQPRQEERRRGEAIAKIQVLWRIAQFRPAGQQLRGEGVGGS